MSESRVKGVSTLPEAVSRWLCIECDHVSETYLTAENPFDEGYSVLGCENCKEVNSLEPACWKCNRPGTIGTPESTEFRYIQTCFEHNPKRVQPEREQK